MKRLLSALVVALVLWAQPAAAAIAYVQSTSALNSSGRTFIDFPSQSATTGNLIVTGVRLASASFYVVSTVTDTAGNTYTKLSTAVAGGTDIEVWWAKNITGNASNVVRITFNSDGPTLNTAMGLLIEYSGLNTTAPLDTEAFGTNTTTPATSAAFTTTQADELLLGFGAVYGDKLSTPAAGSGYTTRITANDLIFEDKIVSATQTGVTASFSSNYNAIQHDIIVSTWKMAGGGGGGGGSSPPPCTLRLLGVGCEVDQ